MRFFLVLFGASRPSFDCRTSGSIFGSVPPLTPERETVIERKERETENAGWANDFRGEGLSKSGTFGGDGNVHRCFPASRLRKVERRF